MELWAYPHPWKPAEQLVAGDRPSLKQGSGDTIELEAIGRAATYTVRLTRDEAVRIAEFIGWRAPGLLDLDQY